MLKLLVLLCLALIVISLGSALIHLLHNRSRSPKTVKALTLRIGLSIALFFALLLAARLGFIKPHGLPEGQSPAPATTPAPGGSPRR
ncbi:MAG TPA: DUF2909 domain-containing protein [Methylococcaceae bacterium]|nr:DUF2909 domain-containing protein [Methylococcaceae bacterium]